MTGYVRLHSLHWKTFSVEWSGRLHLGQAKLIGLINVVSDNEISPLLKMTGVPPNETVEKPLERKRFKKISHNRLKNSQILTKMLCGTSKSRHFLVFPSHFSIIVFEK